MPAWSDRINDMSRNVLETCLPTGIRLSFQIIQVRLLRCNFIMSVLHVRACLETVASLWYQLQCVRFTVPALMPAFYSKYKLDHG